MTLFASEKESKSTFSLFFFHSVTVSSSDRIGFGTLGRYDSVDIRH